MVSYYICSLLLWAALVCLSLWRGKAGWKALAALAVVNVVFVAPIVMGAVGVVPFWGATVLSFAGYVAYWVTDVVFTESPYEVARKE